MSEVEVLHDVIIVGAGPAGLAAGLYAARDRYSALLLEKNGLPGGQIMLTEHIENYPGYEKIGGFELVEH
ncbi:MAG TPA: FAD-dependent oxidoreductase, partial [Phycisphaerae bacterium]|nr:FAD-dependent oxidoreductase [Phycisphaerae bacterium]